MNGLSIDCAISRLSVGAKKDEKTVSAIYDIGMKQSETLLPAIDYILQKSELKPCDLDYISVTTGPGSFTGLRLGLSAAKAISLSQNIPVYAINSLELYAFPFIDFAKENDFDITAEYAAQLFAKLHPNSAVLSDEELTNVAGGGCSSGECKCPRCGSTDLSYHGSYMDIYEKLECNSCRYEFLW